MEFASAGEVHLSGTSTTFDPRNSARDSERMRINENVLTVSCRLSTRTVR